MSLRDKWDNIKRSNICVVEVPKGEERKLGRKKTLWRHNGWNLQNLEKHKLTDPRKNKAQKELLQQKPYQGTW